MGVQNGDVVVRFEDVSHRFGARTVLDRVHFEVRRGDVYGLLGLNGAGKTTTLRLLLRLIARQSGQIRVLGRPLEAHWLELAGHMGATIEAPAFYPQLDGLTNLQLLRDLGGGGGRDPQTVLALVGLAEAARQQTRRYSQGMLQRLYIAQALLGSPELLVLDEPTSNLDPEGILDVRRLIQRLSRDEGVSVILSSHQLSEVEDVCNRVAILHEGRCMVETDVDALFHAEECWVEIETDRPEPARTLIAALPWCREALLEGRSLRGAWSRRDSPSRPWRRSGRGSRTSSIR
jgi:ABC-type multidrug transport system ATPase subunit